MKQKFTATLSFLFCAVSGGSIEITGLLCQFFLGASPLWDSTVFTIKSDSHVRAVQMISCKTVIHFSKKIRRVVYRFTTIVALQNIGLGAMVLPCSGKYQLDVRKIDFLNNHYICFQ